MVLLFWSIPEAQAEARKLQILIDTGHDPRQVKFDEQTAKKARVAALIQPECLGKSKPKNDVLQKEQLKDWFSAVKQIINPVISAYLQTLLLIGSRREELAFLRWSQVDFKWNSLTIHDKVDDFRVIPLRSCLVKVW